MSKNSIALLDIQDLCVEVEGKTVLDHLCLTIGKGEVHALLGANGSGKTSLLMTLMGSSGYEVTGGRILFRGQDITEMDCSERSRAGLAMARQRPPTIRGVSLHSVLTYILGDEPDGETRLMELARAANMEQFLFRGINEGLSGGEIKRSELLQLLALSPAFAMLDEPDSGVDIEALTLVGSLMDDLFASKERAGLVITHNGNVLDYMHIDRAHVLHDGRIGCSGEPAAVMKTIDTYGYEACVRRMQGDTFDV